MVKIVSEKRAGFRFRDFVLAGSTSRNFDMSKYEENLRKKEF